ncbi:synaptonemal complex central element protein 1 [Protopterus annectens]|uniref:synaptonemal complex central element protein 1 n=1 Tax=Protopterus annectens TaxID=7888 RepID=UPI001CFBFF72|nr:synaptonemal complex central element protein 1 [Protopterus annectens]
MSSLGCTSITHAEDIFLRSQEAASAYQLFEEENKSVKRLLEEVSHYYSKLQQKHKRLVNELENQRTGNGNRNKIFTSVNKQIPSNIIRSED